MRQRLSMDRGWRFHLDGEYRAAGGLEGSKTGAFDGPMLPTFDASAWAPVDLPHDFVLGGTIARDPSTLKGHGEGPDPAGHGGYAAHGYRPRGVGWYRKQFFVPAEAAGQSVHLVFDGVCRAGTFWLNRCHLGDHASGTLPARFDVSGLIFPGNLNTLVVRADATAYEGWFYEGGGIYRHAWLEIADPLRVDADGLFVSAALEPGPAPARAAVTVRVSVRNDRFEPASGRVALTLTDPGGRPAGGGEAEFRVEARDCAEIERIIEVARPRLWDLDAPVLYTAAAEVIEGRRTTDRAEARLGIRSIRFDPDRGFLLNGRRVPLQGMCCHQDHAGVGVAVPDDLHAYRIRALQAIGCNAWRCAHNPPAPEFLDACDRLGMLVLDEVRTFAAHPEALTQLESMVRRDRNHPSVILWCLGNEETLVHGEDSGRWIARVMRERLRRLDPTRPVTLAMNGAWGQGASSLDGALDPTQPANLAARGAAGQGASRALDVLGCNYIKCGDIDAFHRQFPDQPAVYTESASLQTCRGIYANDPAAGRTDAYDREKTEWANTAEFNWRHCHDRPWLAGTFVWTGFDYKGEPTPYLWPAVASQFGALDACGFPKDIAGYYRAWWRGEPVAHILPHWNWAGREGQPIEVWVYSNGAEVELSLNGRSLGRKPMPPLGHLEWTVPYAPGVLAARAYGPDGRVVAETARETASEPAGLRLNAHRPDLPADGQAVAVVQVEALDAAGRLAPRADPEITFTVEGGALAGVGNGDPASHESDLAGRRRAFNGLAMAIVRAPRAPGALIVRASAPGLRGAELVLPCRPAAARPAARGVELLPFACRIAKRYDLPDIAAADPAGAYDKTDWRPAVVMGGAVSVWHLCRDSRGVALIEERVAAGGGGPGGLRVSCNCPVRVWLDGRELELPGRDGAETFLEMDWPPGEHTLLAAVHYGFKDCGGRTLLWPMVWPE